MTELLSSFAISDFMQLASTGLLPLACIFYFLKLTHTEKLSLISRIEKREEDIVKAADDREKKLMDYLTQHNKTNQEIVLTLQKIENRINSIEMYIYNKK